MRIPLSAASPPHPFHRLPFQFAAPPPFSPLLRFGPFYVLSLCLLFFPLSSRPSPAAACAVTGTRGGVSLSIRARRHFFSSRLLPFSPLLILHLFGFSFLFTLPVATRPPLLFRCCPFSRSFFFSSSSVTVSVRFPAFPFLPASLLLLLSVSSSNRIRCSPPRRCLSVCPCAGSVTLSPSYMHRVSSTQPNKMQTGGSWVSETNTETKQKNRSPSQKKQIELDAVLSSERAPATLLSDK